MVLKEKITVAICTKTDFRFLIYTPKNGIYLETCPVRIWKRYIPLLIDLLISNNFSSMTFFCATHILRVICRQIIRQSTDFFTEFLA